MKKIKTVLVVMLIFIMLLPVSSKLVINAYNANAERQSIKYLSKKYDVDADEFKLLDSNKAHFYLNEYDFLSFKLEWIGPSFEYSYNGREFIVSKNKNGYYDDYQFDDIHKWAVQYLVENVDERFVGVEFKTQDVLNYQITKAEKYKYIIQESDIEELLKDLAQYSQQVCFYYKDPNVSKRFYVDKELNAFLRKSMESDNYSASIIVGRDSPYKRLEKYKHCVWFSYVSMQNLQ